MDARLVRRVGRFGPPVPGFPLLTHAFVAYYGFVEDSEGDNNLAMDRRSPHFASFQQQSSYFTSVSLFSDLLIAQRVARHGSIGLQTVAILFVKSCVRVHDVYLGEKVRNKEILCGI